MLFRCFKFDIFLILTNTGFVKFCLKKWLGLDLFSNKALNNIIVKKILCAQESHKSLLSRLQSNITE